MPENKITNQTVFKQTFEFTNGYTIEFSDLGNSGLLVEMTDKRRNGAEDSASIIMSSEKVGELRIWLGNLISKDSKKRNVYTADRAHHYEEKKG